MDKMISAKIRHIIAQGEGWPVMKLSTQIRNIYTRKSAYYTEGIIYPYLKDDRENIRCNLIDAYDILMQFAGRHLPDIGRDKGGHWEVVGN